MGFDPRCSSASTVLEVSSLSPPVFLSQIETMQKISGGLRHASSHVGHQRLCLRVQSLSGFTALCHSPENCPTTTRLSAESKELLATTPVLGPPRPQSPEPLNVSARMNSGVYNIFEARGLTFDGPVFRNCAGILSVLVCSPPQQHLL